MNISNDRRDSNELLYPEPLPLTGYGDGAFRFAEQREAGSLCILPSGIYRWRPALPEEVEETDFDLLIAHRAEVDFILFGCGERQIAPPQWLSRLAALAGLGLEVMPTGPAVRTYNLCRDELRLPATFLLPVE